MKLKSLAVAAACVLPMAAFAAAPKVSNGVFTDAAGHTLYTFDMDKTPGTSACKDACVKAWPPAAAASSDKASGDWTIIKGNDGGNQWAYKGKPLYTFAKDAAPGDTKGDNFKDVWHVAKP